MPGVGLQCVIVVFPDHTHFFIGSLKLQGIFKKYFRILKKVYLGSTLFMPSKGHIALGLSMYVCVCPFEKKLSYVF